MPGKIEPDDWAALEADTAEIEAISIIREAYLNERGNLYSGETADIIEDAIFNAVKKAMGRHIKYLRGLMTTRSAVRVHVSKDKETARCFLDINVFADYDKIERISGLNIAIVTTASTDQEARVLLKKLGMPFKK